MRIMIFLSLTLVFGCASKGVEDISGWFVEQDRKVMESLLVERGNVNRIERANHGTMTLAYTPLVAAIWCEPERVQALVDAGANVNPDDEFGLVMRPLDAAITRDMEWRKFCSTRNQNGKERHASESDGYDDKYDLAVIDLLLRNGSWVMNGHVLMAADYLDDRPEYAVAAMKKIVRYHPGLTITSDHVDAHKSLLEVLGDKRPKEELFLEDLKSNGIIKTVSMWKNPDRRLAQERERIANEKMEIERLAILEKKKNQEKRMAVRQYIKQDADLTSALGDVVQSGAYCRTISSMSSTIRSGDGEARCSTTVGGDYFSSPNCEAYREQLSRHVADEKRPLCDAYEKQKSSLAGLFGKNADIVKSLIEQDVSNARPIEEIERVYQPEINRLARLRDKDAASEKRAMDQASRQRMNNLMNYMQNSFTSTTKADQIIQSSVQNIQQQLYVRANNQKMHEINVNLKELDKKLDSIDRQVSEKASNPRKQQASQAQKSEQQRQAALQRQQQQRAEAARQWNQQPGVSNQSQSFSASSGAASTATKTECVARSESTGPKPNIPKQYCQYVFADYTDNVSFGLDDYSNEFMKESHSKESAKKALGFELLKKAKETCKAKGYSRVHHNETYEYSEVDVNVGQCKENNRMGSTFYLCGGTASFICARSD